jgi:hypothetical protein
MDTYKAERALSRWKNYRSCLEESRVKTQGTDAMFCQLYDALADLVKQAGKSCVQWIEVSDSTGLSVTPPNNQIQVGDNEYMTIVAIDGNRLLVTDRIYISSGG